VTGLNVGQLRNHASVNGLGKWFFSYPKHLELVRPASQWLKQVGCEADHSPPSSAEVLPEFLCSTQNTLLVVCWELFCCIILN